MKLELFMAGEMIYLVIYVNITPGQPRSKLVSVYTEA